MPRLTGCRQGGGMAAELGGSGKAPDMLQKLPPRERRKRATRKLRISGGNNQSYNNEAEICKTETQ